MAKEKKAPFDPNQLGEWFCPNCKTITAVACVDFVGDWPVYPIVECVQCGHRFEVGRAGMMEEAKSADNPR